MSGILIALAVVVGLAVGVAFYLRRRDRPPGRSDVDPGEQESSPKVR